MSEGRPDFDQALVRLTEERKVHADHHPDAERWLSYRHGALPPEETEDLQEHLVGCRECSDQLLAVGAFEEAPQAVGDDTSTLQPVGDLATAVAWRLLTPALDRQDAGNAAHRGSLSNAALPRWSQALAASLLAALLGLGAWSFGQHQRLTELSRPKANPSFVYLLAQERAEPEPLVAAAGEPLTLILYPEILSPGAPAAGSLYRVEIVELSGARQRLIQTLEGLVPDEDSALAILLPAGLPPGNYKVDLFSAAAGPTTTGDHGGVSHFLEVIADGGAGPSE